jgi:hypothetical protein
MALQQVPLIGSQVLAEQYQSHLAASKLHLFVSGYVPNPNETLADLTAVEATFSGYPAGGYTISTFVGPNYALLGGSQINSQQIEVAFTAPGSGVPVTNIIAGWFLVDSEGNLIADGLFDNVVPLTITGDGFPITVSLICGTLNTIVQCWIYGSEQ